MQEKSSEGGVVTSVYRKPTFTGLYIVWDSFCFRFVDVRLIMPRALCFLRCLWKLTGHSVTSSGIEDWIDGPALSSPWPGYGVHMPLWTLAHVYPANFQGERLCFVLCTML